MSALDVYVRPQTCTTISIYPPQVHPGGPATSHVPVPGRFYPPRVHRPYDDDETALAVVGAI